MARTSDNSSIAGSHFREIKWLTAHSLPFLSLQFGSLACVIISSLLTLLDPLIMKWLIDYVLPRHDKKLLFIATAVFLLTYICRLIFISISGMLAFLAAQKMIFRIRLKLLRHLQRLSPRHHDSASVGDTMHRVEQDVNQVGELGGDFIPICLRMSLVASMVLVMMLSLNFRLTCIILPLIPLFLLVHWRYHARLRKCSDEVQRTLGMLSNFLQEHLFSIVQVQLLRRQTAEARRFVGLAGRATRAHAQRRITEILFSLVSLSIVVIGITVILGYGGYQVFSGSLSIGGLVAFYSYVVRLFEPLGGAVDVSSKLHRAGASIRRILEIEESSLLIKDHPWAIDAPLDILSTVEFKDVCFEYEPRSPVLKSLNLKVNPGERVALVGASGSGKSTVAKLIVRLYDVKDGMILVGGLNIRDLTLDSLRSSIGLMTQELILFDTTLRENILYGRPMATQKEVLEAAERAQLQKLIRRLPSGLDEPIGPRGSKLSGGERQRVVLARTILQNPSILLLDEPTSAIDARLERVFWESLDQFTLGKTTIVISHSLSTILKADRIAVLDDGRIAEEGTHNQLIQKNRLYWELYEEQLKANSRKSILRSR